MAAASGDHVLLYWWITVGLTDEFSAGVKDLPAGSLVVAPDCWTEFSGELGTAVERIILQRRRGTAGSIAVGVSFR